jgi:hypothetical protein
MPASTQNGHWNIAATATAVAGVALVLLQPQWWEGALYTVFQCSLILWLRPRQPAVSTTDLADSLTEEIHTLRNRLDEQRDLLNRVLPLWDEQIQEAQDQLNMPGTQMTDAAKARINLVIDAVRADMRRLCEIAGHDHDNRMQPDHWLSTFASTATQPNQPQACTVPQSYKKNGAYNTCCEQTF